MLVAVVVIGGVLCVVATLIVVGGTILSGTKHRGIVK